uniref:Uncharacterized protein n=1 Tax=Panagrolaimus sp. ES5 TaxID=591445 RepID=A0AC34FRL6_9BILA
MKDDEFKNSKSANNSTLSLHIAAYETALSSNSNDSEKEVLQKKEETLGLMKKWRTSDILIDRSFAQNPFEFHRQQENRYTSGEVMQFAASQRLLNPNQMDSWTPNKNFNPAQSRYELEILSGTKPVSKPLKMLKSGKESKEQNQPTSISHPRFVEEDDMVVTKPPEKRKFIPPIQIFKPFVFEQLIEHYDISFKESIKMMEETYGLHSIHEANLSDPISIQAGPHGIQYLTEYLAWKKPRPNIDSQNTHVFEEILAVNKIIASSNVQMAVQVNSMFNNFTQRGNGETRYNNSDGYQQDSPQSAHWKSPKTQAKQQKAQGSLLEDDRRKEKEPFEIQKQHNTSKANGPCSGTTFSSTRKSKAAVWGNYDSNRYPANLGPTASTPIIIRTRRALRAPAPSTPPPTKETPKEYRNADKKGYFTEWAVKAINDFNKSIGSKVDPETFYGCMECVIEPEAIEDCFANAFGECEAAKEFKNLYCEMRINLRSKKLLTSDDLSCAGSASPLSGKKVGRERAGNKHESLKDLSPAQSALSGKKATDGKKKKDKSVNLTVPGFKVGGDPSVDGSQTTDNKKEEESLKQNGNMEKRAEDAKPKRAEVHKKPAEKGEEVFFSPAGGKSKRQFTIFDKEFGSLSATVAGPQEREVDSVRTLFKDEMHLSVVNDFGYFMAYGTCINNAKSLARLNLAPASSRYFIFKYSFMDEKQWELTVYSTNPKSTNAIIAEYVRKNYLQ